MSLLEKIDTDLKNALKSQDAVCLGVLRLIKTSIKNKEIEKRGAGHTEPLTDEEVLALLAREAKKRKESIELFTKGGREDLAKKERAELVIVGEYLPTFLTKAEVKAAVQKALEGGTYLEKDFGLIMKKVMTDLKGKADGALVSQVIKEKLTGR